MAPQAHGRVLPAPAQIRGPGDPRLVAALVAAFDEAGVVAPALTDPRGLGVLRRGLAVHCRGVVGQRDRRCCTAQRRRHLDRIRVGEVAHVRARSPVGRRGERRCREAPARAGRAVGRCQHDWRARGTATLGQRALDGFRGRARARQGDFGAQDACRRVDDRGDRALCPALRELRGGQCAGRQGDQTCAVGPGGGLEPLQVERHGHTARDGACRRFRVTQGHDRSERPGGDAGTRIGDVHLDCAGLLRGVTPRRQGDGQLASLNRRVTPGGRSCAAGGGPGGLGLHGPGADGESHRARVRRLYGRRCPGVRDRRFGSFECLGLEVRALDGLRAGAERGPGRRPDLAVRLMRREGLGRRHCQQCHQHGQRSRQGCPSVWTPQPASQPTPRTPNPHSPLPEVANRTDVVAHQCDDRP